MRHSQRRHRVLRMKTFPLLFKTMEEALNYGLTYHATPYVVEVKGGFKAAIKKTRPQQGRTGTAQVNYRTDKGRQNCPAQPPLKE